MQRRRSIGTRLSAWAVVLVLGAAGTLGAEPLPEPIPDDAEGWVSRRADAAYREMSTRFERAVEAEPASVELAVRHCRFIESFVEEDYGLFIAAAADEFEACKARIESRHADTPDGRLFLLDQLWGEEGIEQAEGQLEASQAWPREKRAALLAKLSLLHGVARDATRAGDYAVQAVEHGDKTRLDEAISRLIELERFDEAERLAARSEPQSHAWGAGKRIEILLGLPSAAPASRELARYDGSEFEIDATIAGRVHLKAGDLAMAQRALDRATGDAPALTAARFDLAMAKGDAHEAAQYIGFANEDAWHEDASRAFRVVAHSPGAMLQPSVLTAGMILLLVLAVFALAPGLVLIPVHYRGLVRRARGRAPTPLFAAVGLKRAWLGVAAAMIIPLIVMPVVDPDVAIDLWFERPHGDPAGIFDAMLWSSLASLAACIALVRGMSPRELFGGALLLRSAGWVVLGWISVFGIGAFLVVALGTDQQETEQIRLVRTMTEGGSASVGPILTLLLFALVVPVVEEIVFRGLLLGGMSRHISFGAANLIQATLFALVHGDPPRLPYYLALGLIAGWLVGRYRSVGPAILLHALNNAIATGAVLLFAQT